MTLTDLDSRSRSLSKRLQQPLLRPDHIPQLVDRISSIRKRSDGDELRGDLFRVWGLVGE